jgi:serine O-acetyltransferase
MNKQKVKDLSYFKLIKEDLQAHRNDRTSPGYRALRICRFGKWRMNIKWRLFRAPFSILYKILYRRIKYKYGIELPYTVNIGRRVVFEHQHGIVIHGASIIGDECIIRHGVTLGNRYTEKPLEAPVLGKRVNVGAGAKLLGRIYIGDDAKIGANAVVLHDVPASSIAVGNPAVIKRSKSKDVQ